MQQPLRFFIQTRLRTSSLPSWINSTLTQKLNFWASHPQFYRLTLPKLIQSDSQQSISSWNIWLVTWQTAQAVSYSITVLNNSIKLHSYTMDISKLWNNMIEHFTDQSRHWQKLFYIQLFKMHQINILWRIHLSLEQ